MSASLCSVLGFIARMGSLLNELGKKLSVELVLDGTGTATKIRKVISYE